ncbi:hypothetical protein ACMFMG_004173 [Clarireedia jacksonii]
MPSPQFDTACLLSFDDYDAPLIGAGASAIVLAVNDELAVKLFPSGPKHERDYEREVEIFQKLKTMHSPNIVQFVQVLWDCGIVMERMSMTLRQRLRAPVDGFALEDQWMNDIASGISFLHSQGILHGDIGCQNVLIDGNERAKLCDFAGSRFEDKDAWIHYHIRNQHPGYHQKQPSSATELFALGSVIFEITTRHQPYEHLPDLLVTKRFSEGDFPVHEITRPEIRCIVERCWKSTYVQISEVCEELLELSRNME